MLCTRALTDNSIEGLRRPNSVSFSAEGDLLISDQAARKGNGPTYTISDLGVAVPVATASYVAETNAPQLSRCCIPVLSLWSERGRIRSVPLAPTPVGHRAIGHEKDRAGLTSPSRRSGGKKEEGAEEGREDEEEDGGRDEGRGDGKEEEGEGEGMREPIEWAQGTPVSARFVRAKAMEEGSSAAARGSNVDDSAGIGIAIVVGTSDGTVRVMSGPATRHCGSFAALHDETALCIVELLGYRSSQEFAASRSDPARPDDAGDVRSGGHPGLRGG
eukprot:jgi/Undpi1/11913/HiC_scaffold_4.g01612.m1